MDEIVLRCCEARWRKVALIIGRILDACDPSITADEISQTIGSLVEAGKLEINGDISCWRTSEIRLPLRQTENPPEIEGR
jgi:hypothetical protein